MSKTYRFIFTCLCLLALAGCDGEAPMTDAGPGGGDAGVAPMAAPLSCDEVDPALYAQAVPLDPTLGDQTLDGVYTVTDRVIFDADQVVNIEPGTVLFMEQDAHLIFGWRSDPATVYANGTADAPILLCGVDPTPGSWRGLELLGGTSSDSYLEHVRMEHGGNVLEAALTVGNGVRLESVTVRDGLVPGLLIFDIAEESANLRVTGMTQSAILMNEGAISNFPTGDYTGNERDLAEIPLDYNAPVTFHDRGIPYLQQVQRAIIDQPEAITFEAGVEYRFAQDSFLIVGWRGDEASIYVEGTADEPVVFTSHRDGDGAAPGDWRGLLLDGGTRSDSFIRHAQFRYGGLGLDPMGECTEGLCSNLRVATGGNVTIESSSFESSAGYGMHVIGIDAGTRINTDFEIGGALGTAGNTFASNLVGEILVEN